MACGTDAEFAETPNPWTLTGALIRGPYNLDTLTDSRTSTQTYVQVWPATTPCPVSLSRMLYSCWRSRAVVSVGA